MKMIFIVYKNEKQILNFPTIFYPLKKLYPMAT